MNGPIGMIRDPIFRVDEHARPHVARGPVYYHRCSNLASTLGRAAGQRDCPHTLVDAGRRRDYLVIYISTFQGVDDLPATFEPAFADPRTGNVFHTRPWLEAFARHGIEAGARFRLYAIASDGVPLALLPATVSRLYRVHRRARVLHFAQPEGEPYVPLLPDANVDLKAVLYGLLECLSAERRPCDVIRMSPLEPDVPFARELVSMLRTRHYPLQIYRHLDDRYENTQGMSSASYLSARPGKLRVLLLERGAPFFDVGRASFRVIRDASEVTDGIAAYQSVLEKNPEEAEVEPPDYVGALMQAAAAGGALRLGLIIFDGEPAAVQLWIVSAGVARCVRIWSDPAHAALPVDDMLTERLVAHLLDVDAVRELDFGSIESEYARNWAPQTRKRVGIIAFNPRTWRGIKGAVRHIALPKLLAFPRRVRRRLLGRAA